MREIYHLLPLPNLHLHNHFQVNIRMYLTTIVRSEIVENHTTMVIILTILLKDEDMNVLHEDIPVKKFHREVIFDNDSHLI